MLRIRPDNATIRELKIPKENLEELQKILSSPKTTDDIKKLNDKEISKGISLLYMWRNSFARSVYDVKVLKG